MVLALIVGAICAGMFVLVGPVGIIVIGIILALAGVSVAKDD